MGKPGKTGLARIIDAGGYSAKGLKAAWQHEAAFRQELVLAVVLTPLAFVVGASLIERIVLLALTWLVLVVELLNSAVEAVVDRIGSEHHPLSGRAKDMGSAAVLISLLVAGGTWVALAVQNLF